MDNFIACNEVRYWSAWRWKVKIVSMRVENCRMRSSSSSWMLQLEMQGQGTRRCWKKCNTIWWWQGICQWSVSASILHYSKRLYCRSNDKTLSKISFPNFQARISDLQYFMRPWNVNKTKHTTCPQGWRWHIIENRSFFYFGCFARKTVVM